MYRTSQGVTEILVGRGLDLAEVIGGKAVAVVDENSPIRLPVPTLVLTGGESVKGIETLTKIYEFLFDNGVDREWRLVAVGGGAVLDVAGFAAATYARGIPLVNVPTTLLAMVDTAIGGKTAINWGRVKNLVGAFYQPEKVIAELSVLDALPAEVYVQGLAEVVKYGVTLSDELFNWLAANRDRVLARDPHTVEELVYVSAMLKARVVEMDEREERGIRQVLNFGHTIGHAIELVKGLPHGYAVAIGMVHELRYLSSRGLTSADLADKVAELLVGIGLPTHASLTCEEAREAAAKLVYDKKRRGDHILMPVPPRLGRWYLEKVPVRDLASYVESLCHGGIHA